MYFEVVVIAEHNDNILFFHYSKCSKMVFEYESLAIFAGNILKNTHVPSTHYSKKLKLQFSN